MSDILPVIRHSFAHLLAAAVLKLYPDAKPTIGPAIDDGFYYDFDFITPVGDEDLKRIEKEMRNTLKTWKDFQGREVSPAEARQLFTTNPYKLELIDDIVEKGEPLTLYRSGDFEDLCRGGHAENISLMRQDAFKLTRIAGAYWRGDEKQKMLTRIYGYAFENKEALQTHILRVEEAKKRDHRILGEKLDLFCFDESIGKGLPLWLPKGNILKEELEKWAKETETKWGYQRVTTPLITKEHLFYTSGHLPLYKDSMYAPLVIEEENYYLKPMNCPFHHKIFSARPRSYRELPLRIAEYGWCHRYEDSGSLFGLMRVRGMQMNDAHIYVSREQAVEEFIQVIKLHEYYYQKLGITEYMMELALRDPKNLDKYHGDEADWQDAEAMTKEAMEKSGVPYTIVHEGAAFYGPKMDFQITSSIGRTFTASTNQLDLFMGKKFDLEYTDVDGKKKTPIVIHRAPLGTHERFIGFLIEHTAGNFPLWIAPEQVRILPIGEGHQTYAKTIETTLREASIRVSVDDSNESLGKRIRNAKLQKIPYLIVVGDKEIETKTFSLESRDRGQLGSTDCATFLADLHAEISNKHSSAT
ncbi:MAG: threonine--tRNA ligase [Candidatus Moranbacteria bacterium]|jgi:threonyl-tRNA synthetase|nr:threonine--tRNA ligase [Candidatus Moranbacteria bacterium]MBP9801643.1 threonine--tRNA ligase [Candidatus Moranbacteria bacterium]